MTSKAKTYDQYFTPARLADRLIGAFTIAPPSCVGDFAAGDGMLLIAAQKRWSHIKCIAIDIDEEVISKLKSHYPKWKSHVCDFTNSEARDKIFKARNRNTKFSAIALNPPFSIRKGEVRIRKVSIAGKEVKCSPALAFIIDALAYLRKGGQLVAIVPQGVIQNSLDSQARELLKKLYGFEIVDLISPYAFSNCAPRTAIVRFTCGVQRTTENIKAEIKAKLLTARLLRGSISNTKVESSNHPASLPFIHTTDLLNGRLLATAKNIFISDVAFAIGPAVLIPRVGRPDINKLAILPNGSTAVLSDCIMAVECLNVDDAHLLLEILVKNWQSLEKLYGGTCARYISVNTLQNFLVQIGCYLVSCLKKYKEPFDQSLTLKNEYISAQQKILNIA